MAGGGTNGGTQDSLDNVDVYACLSELLNRAQQSTSGEFRALSVGAPAKPVEEYVSRKSHPTDASELTPSGNRKRFGALLDGGIGP